MSKQIDNAIEDANVRAVDRIQTSRPILIDVRPAIEVIPGMKKNSIFHAGPPIEWNRMSGPLRGAIVATMIFEGLAESWEEAVELIRGGEIEFSSNHDHDAVGGVAGTISASLPVLIVKNKSVGDTSFGRAAESKVQFGAFDEKAIQILRFWAKTLGPALGKAIRLSKGIDLKALMATALYMRDELHIESVAGTALFEGIIMPHLIEVVDKEELLNIVRYFAAHDFFFVSMSMAACKSMMRAAHGVEYSTLVTTMTANGTDFGIRVSALGNDWFLGPAPIVEGKYFEGYRIEDANPRMGDSTITETAGIGAFGLTNSPAILSLLGVSYDDATKYTKQMQEITISLNNTFSIPAINFQGPGVGIDIRKVVGTGILPITESIITHKEAGIGIIGAGLARAPAQPFKEALYAFGRKYNI